MRALACLVLVACSSRGTTHGSLPPAGPIAAPDAKVPGAAIRPAPAAVTATDCEAMFAHALGLATEVVTAGAAAPSPSPTPSLTPTPAELATLQGELRAHYLAECLQQPPSVIHCALAAPTLARFTACQETPSSSTSNSSVAPPGIAPPAPRSP